MQVELGTNSSMSAYIIAHANYLEGLSNSGSVGIFQILSTLMPSFYEYYGIHVCNIYKEVLYKNVFIYRKMLNCLRS